MGESVAHTLCENVFSGISEPFCGVMALVWSFAVTFNKHQQLEGASKKKDLKAQPSGTKKHLKDEYRTTTTPSQMRHTGTYIFLQRSIHSVN